MWVEGGIAKEFIIVQARSPKTLLATSNNSGDMKNGNNVLSVSELAHS